MKRVLISLGLLLLVASAAFATVRFEDTFTDETYRPMRYHSPDVAATTYTSWADSDPRMFIYSNCAGIMDLSAAVTQPINIGGYTFPVTITAQVIGLYVYSGGAHGFVFRYVDASNYYRASLVGSALNSTIVRIDKVIDGSYTNVTQCVVALSYNNGSHFRLLDTGYDLTLYTDVSTNPATTLRLWIATDELTSPEPSQVGVYGVYAGNKYVLSSLKVEDASEAVPVATATPWPGTRTIFSDNFTGTSMTALADHAPDIDPYAFWWGNVRDWKLITDGYTNLTPAAADTNTITASFDLGTKVGYPRRYYLKYRVFGATHSAGFLIRMNAAAKEIFRVYFASNPSWSYAVGATSVFSQTFSTWYNSGGYTYKAMLMDYGDRVYIFGSESGGEPTLFKGATAVPTTTAGGFKFYANSLSTLGGWYDELTITAQPLEPYPTATPTATITPTFTITPTVTVTATATPIANRRYQHRQRRWPKWIRLPGLGDTRG